MQDDTSTGGVPLPAGRQLFIVFEFAGFAAMLVGAGMVLAISSAGKIDAYFIGTGVAVAGLCAVAIGTLGIKYNLKLW